MTGLHSTVVARVLAALILLSCRPLVAPAEGASVQLLCPADAVDAGSNFDAQVVIDVGADVLGAYTLALVHDPAVFLVADVTGGDAKGFSTRPIVNVSDFPTGRTRMSAFNTVSVTAPTGVVRVAEVALSVLSAVGQSAAVGVEVMTLADVDGARIGEVTTESCIVNFANATPASTATMGASSPTPSPVSTATSPPATASASPMATPTPTEEAASTATPTVVACAGDCNFDDAVTADELVLAVNIALGRESIDECRALDQVADRAINVDEIVAAVDTALHGCLGRGAHGAARH